MDFDERDEAEENMGLSHYEAEKPSVGASGSGSAHRKSAAGVRYRECQKNHAVSIGGHAVDGCCEFLPAGDEGSLDALRCAACNCHRNFHRKEMDGGMEPTSGGAASSALFYPYYRAPAGYLQQAHYSARPVQLALPSTSGGGREELDDVSNPMGFGFGSAGGPGSSSGKKRFRTKFSQEQKDKMLAFAEAVGWRIQKQDEATVQQFCSDASVKRHVLKVWMHNNKHSLEMKGMGHCSLTRLLYFTRV